MKNSYKILAVFICLISVISLYYYKLYQEQKVARSSVNAYISRVLPEMTPSEVFKHYWQFANEGRIKEIRLFTTIEPISFNVKCGDLPKEEPPSPSEIYWSIDDQDFAGLNDNLANFTDYLSISRFFDNMKIKREIVYKHEAIVDFETTSKVGINNYQALLKKRFDGWRIFYISSKEINNFDDFYAKERPHCETTPTIKNNLESGKGNEKEFDFLK